MRAEFAADLTMEALAVGSQIFCALSLFTPIGLGIFLLNLADAPLLYVWR